MKLGLRLALLVVNGLGLLTLLVGSYDAFTYRSNDFWTPRDWYIGWGNSWVHTDTKAAVGLFVVLALGLYLAWHSHTLLGRIDPKGGKLRNASSNVTNGILPKKHGNIPL